MVECMIGDGLRPMVHPCKIGMCMVIERCHGMEKWHVFTLGVFIWSRDGELQSIAKLCSIL